MAPQTVHYAIGDIHGRLDMLEKLMRKIEDHRARYHAGSPAALVFVGDYVDRGPDSAGVIAGIMRGFEGFDPVCLKGNHEAMLIECLATGDRDQWMQWISNGGDATLRSLDYDTTRGRDPDALRKCLGGETVEWLLSLKLHHKIDDVLFVHAGVRPGIALEKQDEKDLLWIRQAFLASREDFGFGVVHGHTPVGRPEIRKNRINIDTGAVFDGALTALVVDRPWQQLHKKPKFVQVKQPGFIWR
ncbi:MAG: serine/threonine protein phosphatase [Hyphomicrobiales bacterium]|nr:serine/threonine protein phosphatase [Hyphomicrobiales bacterium]MCP4997769.1 serine/threonine protein phosphatase [Hyphomicrobiales bacterium]